MNPNDPAFPCGNGIQPYNTGIPIRLYIAAQIMAGFASWSGNSRGDFIPIERATKCSLEWADALIAEYNKETK